MNEPVGKVSALHFYPVKSCGRVSVDSLEVGPLGPLWDRRWMIVDEGGKMLTQRVCPQLAVIRPRMHGKALLLEAEGVGECIVDIDRCEAGDLLLVHVWSEQVRARDCGDDVARWLSGFLAREVRLAFMSAQEPRIREKGIQIPMGFADSRPFLVTNHSSLSELNAVLSKPVPMSRFRPNIEVSEAGAFSEHEWRSLKIGEIEFPESVHCVRCIITSIDQETGVRHGREPLKTLATFSPKGEGLVFGRRFTHSGTGLIRIGDAVFANF